MFDDRLVVAVFNGADQLAPLATGTAYAASTAEACFGRIHVHCSFGTGSPLLPVPFSFVDPARECSVVDLGVRLAGTARTTRSVG